MNADRRRELGARVARLISGLQLSPKSSLGTQTLNFGHWTLDKRPSAVNGRLSVAELDELTPILLQSGAGALAWWCLRDTELANTPAGFLLHEAYRQQRLSALLHERDLVRVLTLFRAQGIEAVLVKGWAIARHYPEPALRAYGDLDLCVAPAQFAKATKVLAGIQSLDGPFVDLHPGFGEVGRRKRQGHDDAWEELYGRSYLSNVQSPKPKVSAASPKSNVESPMSSSGEQTLDDSFPVRILSDEDHLRLLCVHMLRSGARRPLWLCDVAVMLDSTNGFDWDRCLSSNPVHAEWIGLALSLAHELLGADISHTPFAGQQAPRWVVNEVLEQWGGKAVGRRQTAGGRKTSLKSNVQRRKSSSGRQTLDLGPWTLDWYRRWDNPIRATAAVGGKFSDRPQLRYRVAEMFARLPELRTKL